jgi:hypothetical protein
MVDTLVNLQDLHEPIVTTSAINLSQKKVYHIPDWLEVFLPLWHADFYLFSGFQLLRVALIWPFIHRLRPAWCRWSTTTTDWRREPASTYEGPALCSNWHLGPGFWRNEAPFGRDPALARRSSANQALAGRTSPLLPGQSGKAHRRIKARRSQASLKVDIAEKCRLVNDKKADLDAKTDILERELEDLKQRVWATERLIQDEKNFMASSKQEAEDLATQLKIELAELSILSRQIVSGEDKDDEAAIVEVNRVRLEAIGAIDEFLQKNAL